MCRNAAHTIAANLSRLSPSFTHPLFAHSSPSISATADCTAPEIGIAALISQKQKRRRGPPVLMLSIHQMRAT